MNNFIPSRVKKGLPSLRGGGSGNGPEPLNETYLGRWLALVRIQSFPVTVIILCMGYLTVSEAILTRDALAMVTVGAFGHAAFYAMNDLFDAPYDKEHKDQSKALVSGEIKLMEAFIGTFILLMVCLILAQQWFDQTTFYVFVASCFMGLIYNIRSKKDWFSSTYLSLWGMLITFTGALHAGGFNEHTFIISIVFGFQMAMITILGDIKDIDADEPSIPSMMGLGFDYDTDTIRKWIVIYTVVSIILIALFSSLFISFHLVMGLCLGGVVWGLTWQKIQYGSAFFFP